MTRFLVVFPLLLLTLEAPVASVSSQAILAPGPGFWDGLVHGVLSLPKLLLSPFVDVTLVVAGDHLLSYDVGFYVGVLLFAGAGAAAAAATPETDD